MKKLLVAAGGWLMALLVHLRVIDCFWCSSFANRSRHWFAIVPGNWFSAPYASKLTGDNPGKGFHFLQHVISSYRVKHAWKTDLPIKCWSMKSRDESLLAQMDKTGCHAYQSSETKTTSSILWFYWSHSRARNACSFLLAWH